MRKRWTRILLGLALSSSAVIACSSGSGPFAVPDDPYDRPPDSRDKPGVSRDKPGDTWQAPPPSTENPGPQGGGPSSTGGGSNCPPCDGTFKCVSMLGSKSDTDTVVLMTVNGKCAVIDHGKPTGTIECGGALISEGKPVGTWTSTSKDSFSASASGTVNGQPITVTTNCTRGASQPTSTGTVTPTPVPTTPKPPTVTDAGTKG